jgi:adenylate cyclase
MTQEAKTGSEAQGSKNKESRQGAKAEPASSADRVRSPRLREGQSILTTGVYERPPSERPSHDTLEGIAAWLIGPARQIASAPQAFDEYAWRLYAAGLPVLRVTLHCGTLHPQFLGSAYVWWRNTAQTQEIMVMHEVVDVVPYAENLVARVRNGGETVRRRLDGPEARLDFPILHDIKAQGGTEYFGFPVASAYGTHMASYTTDQPGGFSEEQIAQLRAVSERLSVLADTHIQRQIAENVLKAYLGPQTGPLVLAGKIRRGTGDTINAVLWSSDVRSFTAFSDRVPGQQVIAKLDQIFDGQARAIAKHGGEILKFIGDGLLAIFPVDAPDQAALAAAEALTAATEALESVQALGAGRHGIAVGAGHRKAEIVWMGLRRGSIFPFSATSKPPTWRATPPISRVVSLRSKSRNCAAHSRRSAVQDGDRAALRVGDLRQYRRRRPAGLHGDRTRRQSGQPDRGGGEIARSAARGQRRFCPRLWGIAALARPAQTARPRTAARVVYGVRRRRRCGARP